MTRAARRIRFLLALALLAPLLAAFPLHFAEATSLDWQSIGPDGGRIDGFAQSSSVPTRMYVAPYRLGVYRSDDRGDTWARVDTNLPPDLLTQQIAVSPTDPAVLLLGKPSSGEALRSTDGGVTWTTVIASAGHTKIHAIAFDPDSADVVLLAAEGGADPGLHRSTDAGISWAPANSGLSSLDPKAIAFDPGAAGVLLTGTSDGIFRSTDSGATWTAVDTGGTGSIQSISFCDGTPSRVWAIGYPGGLLRSDDGGLTFAPGDQPPTNDYVSIARVATHPVNPAIVIVGRYEWTCGGDCFARANLVHSTDAGATWAGVYQSTASSTVNHDYAAVIYDVEDPARAYVALSNIYSRIDEAGLLRSTDHGASWATALSGVHAVRIFDAGEDVGGPVLVRGTGPDALWRSSSPGGAWTALLPPASGGSGAATAFEVSPTVPGLAHEIGNHFSMDTADPLFHRSTDSGNSWVQAWLPQNGLFEFPTVVVADHATGETVYVWTVNWDGDDWLHRFDFGVSLLPAASLNPGFAAACAVVDPIDPMRLFAVEALGSGEVKLSPDGGVTWESRSTGLPSDYAVALFQDLGSPNRLRVIYETAGAWSSEDDGMSWALVPMGLGGAVVVDADWDPVGDRLFLATRDDGVWMGPEGFHDDGLPTRDLTSIAWAPQAGVVLLGTDHASLWMRAPADSTVVATPERPLGGSDARLRLRPNPFVRETSVEFRLPTANSPYDVSVYSVDGRRIANLARGASTAGWTTVVWDGRAASGSITAPGVYFVRLETADRVVTKRVVRLAH